MFCRSQVYIVRKDVGVEANTNLDLHADTFIIGAYLIFLYIFDME